MTERSDWEAAAQEWLDEERRKLGEPPSTETLLAYERGALDATEAARVREYLELDPQIARVLSEPIGTVEDAGSISEHEVAASWVAFKRRLPAQHRRHHVMRGFATAAAVAISIFVFWAFRTISDQRQLIARLQQPRTQIEIKLLLPSVPRGTEELLPVPLSANADSFVLTVPLVNQPHYPRYRLQLMDISVTPARVRWTAEDVPHLSNDTFQVWVPRSFLSAGRTYELVVSGVAGPDATTLAAYRFRL